MASLFGTNTSNLLIPFIDDTYELTLIQNRPFFDRINKFSGRGGKVAHVPINAGFGGGSGNGSGGMAVAIANAGTTGANTIAFDVDATVNYGTQLVNGYEADFTNGPESAISADMLATKAAMEIAAQDFEDLVFGTSYGNFGTISSVTNPSGNIWVIVFTVPSVIAKFSIGQVIVSKVAFNSAALDTGTGIITGLNYLNASITVDVGASGMVPTATHVVGVQSFMQASTTSTTVPGIFGYIPDISQRGSDFVPTVTTFMGVDRSNASSIMTTSGWAFDGRNRPLFSAVNTLAGKMAAYKNNKPTLLICNNETMATFSRELQTQVLYNEIKSARPDVYFDGFYINTAAGRVEVLAESACPSNLMVLTNPKAWNYEYPGKQPFKPVNRNGDIFQQAYGLDQYRAAIKSEGFFYTTNPASTGVITVA